MIEGFTVHLYNSTTDRVAADPHGGLIFTDQSGMVHRAVLPVRAFPIDAADEGVSLVGSEGHELAWIVRLSDVDVPTRNLIAAELARREFMPVIERLEAVSTFGTPSTWSVVTDRGYTRFVLKGEEDIRRLRNRALLITDSHGVTYHVVDLQALDRTSRRLLDRFL